MRKSVFYSFVLLFKQYRVFLSRNYRLIVAPMKFDVLKTNSCPRSEALRANVLVLQWFNGWFLVGSLINNFILSLLCLLAFKHNQYDKLLICHAVPCKLVHFESFHSFQELLFINHCLMISYSLFFKFSFILPFFFNKNSLFSWA